MCISKSVLAKDDECLGKQGDTLHKLINQMQMKCSLPTSFGPALDIKCQMPWSCLSANVSGRNWANIWPKLDQHVWGSAWPVLVIFLPTPWLLQVAVVIAGLMSGKCRKSCLSEKVLSCPKVAEVKKIFWAAPAIKYALLHLSSHMTMSVICLNEFSTFPQIMPSRGNVSDGDGITCLLYILK